MPDELALELHPDNAGGAQIVVSLVAGYNILDCALFA